MLDFCSSSGFWIVTLDHRRDPWAFFLPAFHFIVCVCVPFRVCVYVLFPRLSSFRSAMPLPICWLPVEQQLPPFLLPPSSLLPPCSLIPPSPSLFVCHLVSYVRGMGGNGFGAWVPYVWPAAIVLLSLVCCGGTGVFSLLAGWSEREREIRLWRTNGCTWGFQCPFAQVSRAEATLIEQY